MRACVRTRIRGGRGHIGEGIKKMRQIVGNMVLLQVGNVVAGVINAPLLEPPAEYFLVGESCLILVLGERWNRAYGER